MLCFIHDCTPTPTLYLEAFISFSMHFYFFNVFSLDVCWTGTGRHYSCQHSVSLPLLKFFTVNQTFFSSLNVAMKITCRDARTFSTIFCCLFFSHVLRVPSQFSLELFVWLYAKSNAVTQ